MLGVAYSELVLADLAGVSQFSRFYSLLEKQYLTFANNKPVILPD